MREECGEGISHVQVAQAHTHTKLSFPTKPINQQLGNFHPWSTEVDVCDEVWGGWGS